MVTLAVEKSQPAEEPHLRLARMYEGKGIPQGLLNLWGDMLQAAPSLNQRVREVSRDEWHASMATIPATENSDAFAKEIE